MPAPTGFSTRLLGIDVEIPTSVEARWTAEFERQRDRHAEFEIGSIGPLAPAVRRGLAHSLPIFHLGEASSGVHLMAEAERDGTGAYHQAVESFVYEEQDHARLLAMVCTSLGIDLIDDHWSDRAFRRIRRISGLRTEMLTLLVAEMIAVPFFDTLSKGVGDPALAEVFGRIHADEQRHLAFHAATLPGHLSRWSPKILKTVRMLWGATFVGSAAVVAWDHRLVLRACNSGMIRFFREALALFRQQEARYFPADD